MPTTRPDEQTARSGNIVDVRVELASGGGWNVTATLGDRIVAIHHCDDWHRAERALLRMSRDAQLHRGEAA